MDIGTMVRTNLQFDYIQLGKEVVKLLDKTEFKVDAALWYYISDYDSWRLYIASESFSRLSKLEAYRLLAEKFRNKPAVKKLGLENISLLDSDDELFKALGVLVKTDKTTINGIRLQSININNVYIEDAYVYRLA